MIKAYIDKLIDWQSAIIDGEEVEPAEIEALLSAAVEIVPESSVDDVQRLARAVESLERLIRDRYEEVGEELRRLGQGRQALKGYNHLRGHHEGQRLYRRA